MKTPHAYKWNWFKQLFVVYFTQGFPIRAAYLAYLTLICLVPMLTIAVLVVSHFVWFQHIATQWQSWLVNNLLADSVSSIKPVISQLIQHATTLSVGHTFAFLVLTVMMMINISQAFRSIWHTDVTFSLSLRFLIYALILLVSPIVLVLIFMTGGLFSHWMKWLVSSGGHEFLLPVFAVSSHLLLFVWFFLMNLILPGCRVPLRAAVISGAATTLLLWAAKYLFVLAMHYFTTYQVLYGALSVVPIFLVWLYVSWMLILFGAQIGHMVVRPTQVLSGLKGES